jgi:hypothetical protein
VGEMCDKLADAATISFPSQFWRSSCRNDSRCQGPSGVDASRCRVPHTFAGFECVGDHRSTGGDLAQTGRYDNSCPLIPMSGMSGPEKGNS